MPLFEFKDVPKVSVLSTTYIKCTVSATEAGLQANPTSGTVSFSFVDDALNTNPSASAWVAGSWETTSEGYRGLCLLGPSPGVVQLPVGGYDVWVKVVKGSETVIDRVGKLRIY